ncbi:MAG: hypothetical protein K0R55_4185 [Sporomusa sp.]|nr:hypothetical protein [Sporomusa sp.]
MNISSISASNNLTPNTKTSSIVNSLQKQKMDLSKQLEEVKASDKDSKSKAEMINQITAQIAELDQQIVQARIEERQKEMEAAQEKRAEREALKKYENEEDQQTKAGVVLSASLGKLLSANNGCSEYVKMHEVYGRLKGEMNTAQSEIKNSHNGGSIKYQMSVVEKKSTRISALAANIAEKVDEIQKDIDLSVKVGKKEAEKVREHDEHEEQHKVNTENGNTVNHDGKVPMESTILADSTIYDAEPTELAVKNEKKSKLDIIV